MDNNFDPIDNNIPSPENAMPDLPSVDDITVAEMPELAAVPETVSEALEQAVEAAPEAVEQVVEVVPEAVEAAPEAQPVQQVPVVQEYPENSGTPQYTSYVPANSAESPAPEVYTAPVTPAPVAATPVYGTPQQPVTQQPAVRPVPVYVPGTAAASTTAGHGKAVASLVLGLFALLFSPCCCFGFIPGIIGICMGASARSDGNREGLSTAGIVLSIISLILSVVLTLSCGAIMNSAGETMQSMPEFNEFYNEMYDEMYGVIRMFFM